jgi:hypothetical protein
MEASSSYRLYLRHPLYRKLEGERPRFGCTKKLSANPEGSASPPIRNLATEQDSKPVTFTKRLISHYNKTLLSSHIQGVSFKTKLRNHVLHCKMDTYAGPRACNIFSHPPSWHQMKVSHVARPLLTPVALKLCRYEHGVFTSRTCVHSRTLLQMKSFDAVREAFSNAYPVKDVPSKTTIHRLVTTFRDAGSVCVSSGRG